MTAPKQALEPEAAEATPPLPPHQASVRAGFRLERLEVYNWGTFHDRVWPLDTRCENTLLTGEVGSGKSTLVDAMTTLLVAPQKLSYNKAANADKDERSLRTYVLGHYKKERSDTGPSAKPVALRDRNTYSVILGRFFNEGYSRHVTLAQVFWWKTVVGQPDRLYVVADKPMSIAEHFGSFTDIRTLRKRLKRLGAVLSESYPPYSSVFRSRFGIENPQALELFHQTVSMKSVGNLTDFVRQHMLEPSEAGADRIKALIRHFEDLNLAHEAVLKAKAQITHLTPLVADCRRLQELMALSDRLRTCREALRPWFAEQRRDLLVRRLTNLATELKRIEVRLESLNRQYRDAQASRDDVKQAIAASGGDRIERLKRDIEQRKVERDQRRARAEQYRSLAKDVGLPGASEDVVFLANREAIVAERSDAEEREAQLTNERTDLAVQFRSYRDKHNEVQAELDSLRQRRSNIPARMLQLREAMCAALKLKDEALPFAGELIQVRPSESAWEGAAERLLHNFALSLLVADAHYLQVVQWVDRTNLRNRLVYYRVHQVRGSRRSGFAGSQRSLVNKLEVRPDSTFSEWLEAEVARRFDFACCDTIDQFRREPRGITAAGQIKAGNERHEKDDRHRIDDRARYVLGWSNEAKIAALEAEAQGLQRAMQENATQLSALQGVHETLKRRLGALQQLAVFERFSDLDWQPLEAEIGQLEREREQLESESDVLRTLQEQLAEIERSLTQLDEERDKEKKARGATEEKQARAEEQERDCAAIVAAVTPELRSAFAELEGMRTDALGEHQLTLESADNRERDMRSWLQDRIDAEDKKIGRLRDGIVQQMKGYCVAYPVETREVDCGVAAAGEFELMLSRLQADDLPRFEQRFKELLNENTIREVANFQSQLKRESESIKERIETINLSLRTIDYNPGRYISLEAVPETDKEIREFRERLRACTENALTGSDDESYSEQKFLQVKEIIERFRGREGTTDSDLRWTRKVTDVRNWFTFAASEKWKEDDADFEHYADSGGKSGGQKEKLAYTVLAASLAYQFGLEWGAQKSRSFRFVVIDEAFGRGDDGAAQYGLELFNRLNLQLLIVTPLQKIHIIEPYVSAVGYVHNEEGRSSMVRNLTIEEYRSERAARDGSKQ